MKFNTPVCLSVCLCIQVVLVVPLLALLFFFRFPKGSIGRLSLEMRSTERLSATKASFTRVSARQRLHTKNLSAQFLIIPDARTPKSGQEGLPRPRQKLQAFRATTWRYEGGTPRPSSVIPFPRGLLGRRKPSRSHTFFHKYSSQTSDHFRQTNEHAIQSLPVNRTSPSSSPSPSPNFSSCSSCCLPLFLRNLLVGLLLWGSTSFSIMRLSVRPLSRGSFPIKLHATSPLLLSTSASSVSFSVAISSSEHCSPTAITAVLFFWGFADWQSL